MGACVLSDSEKGEQLWERPQWNADWKAGPGKKFEDVEEFWSACVHYFEWCIANPLKEQKAMGTKDGIEKVDLSKMRAFTIGGLCLYIGISLSTFQEWRREGHVLFRPEMKDIIDRVKAIIREQKFVGASAGLLNQAIIARDLGLVEKTELAVPDGIPVRVSPDMTTEEKADAFRQMLEEGKGDS
jgi:hypothetical protein